MEREGLQQMSDESDRIDPYEIPGTARGESNDGGNSRARAFSELVESGGIPKAWQI